MVLGEFLLIRKSNIELLTVANRNHYLTNPINSYHNHSNHNNLKLTVNLQIVLLDIIIHCLFDKLLLYVMDVKKAFAGIQTKDPWCKFTSR